MLLPKIETQRLRLRQFELSDWQAVYAYTSDAAAMTYIPEGQFSPKQAQQFVEKNTGAEAQAFPVILKAADQVIGHMIFHPWFGPRTLEIGWVIHPGFQGTGYATEAARALLRYSFEELKSHRVIATCQPENSASYRVMEKLGMRREGHFRQCIYRGGDRWWDEYFYALLAEEWFRKQANGRSTKEKSDQPDKRPGGEVLGE